MTDDDIQAVMPELAGQGLSQDNTLDSAYPFARLATCSVTLADRSSTFLYHHLNGTTFAEEQWDSSLKT